MKRNLFLPTDPPDDGLPDELHPALEELDAVVTYVEDSIRTIRAFHTEKWIADYILSLRKATEDLPASPAREIDVGEYVMYLEKWAMEAGTILAKMIRGEQVAVEELWGQDATSELVTWWRGRLQEASDRMWVDGAGERDED